MGNKEEGEALKKCAAMGLSAKNLSLDFTALAMDTYTAHHEHLLQLAAQEGT